jgi:hypothetical protein
MGQSRMDNPEIMATLGTQYIGQINVRENRRDNQEWTIKNGQSRDIGNVGHTRHRIFHQAKHISNTDTTNIKPRMKPDAREG